MASDEGNPASEPNSDYQRDDLRRTMEPAARRLDLAWERLNFARYGPEGKPDSYLKYEALFAIPGLTPAERISMFMDPGEKKPDSPDLPEAQKEYREARDAFYTPEFFEQLERLRRGDQSAIEFAIVYMEIDPWHFRSGYMKQKLARFLRHVPLSETQGERLRVAILAALPKGQREDVREYASLARVLDSPSFRAEIESLSSRPDEGTGRRARRVLSAMTTVNGQPAWDGK